jgi:Ca2+-binding EF-hand superfamily protein
MPSGIGPPTPPPANASPLRRYKNAPCDTFSFGEEGVLIDDASAALATDATDAPKTITPVSARESSSWDLMSAKESNTSSSLMETKGSNASSGMGVLIVANDHGHVVRSLIYNALKVHGVVDAQIFEVPDAMMLPFVTGQLLQRVSSLLVAGVLSSDSTGSAFIGQTICASVFQAGLLANKPVYPGIVLVKDALEVRACVPPAVSKWTQSMLHMVHVQQCPLSPVLEHNLAPATPAKRMIRQYHEAEAVIVGAHVVDVVELLSTLRKSLKVHGAYGIFGLQRKFKIADDDGNKKLSAEEFKKMISEHALSWQPAQVQLVYNYFDKDGSGEIDFNEFLVSVRGPLSHAREQLVLKAFKVLDASGDGVVDINDIKARYNAQRHPDVISGKCTETEVLEAFLDTFNGTRHDGKVAPKDFCEYYSNVSASIDDDDYFELMIRNAWHISGGSGWSANTSCRRILVTHTDGRQTVEEIKDDLGIGDDDVDVMIRNLEGQGITDVETIEVKGSKTVVGSAPATSARPSPSPSELALTSSLVSTPANMSTGTDNSQLAAGASSAMKNKTQRSVTVLSTKPGGMGGVLDHGNDKALVAGSPAPTRPSRLSKRNPQTVSSITF